MASLTACSFSFRARRTHRLRRPRGGRAICRSISRPGGRPACWAAAASARRPSCAGWPACCPAPTRPSRVAYMAQRDLLLPWLTRARQCAAGLSPARRRGSAPGRRAARTRRCSPRSASAIGCSDRPRAALRRHAPARGAGAHALRGPPGRPDGRALRPSRRGDASRAAGPRGPAAGRAGRSCW